MDQQNQPSVEVAVETQPFVVAEMFDKQCKHLVDKIVKAKCEKDLSAIAAEIKWPVEAVVTAWALWKMGVAAHDAHD